MSPRDPIFSNLGFSSCFSVLCFPVHLRSNLLSLISLSPNVFLYYFYLTFPRDFFLALFVSSLGLAPTSLKNCLMLISLATAELSSLSLVSSPLRLDLVMKSNSFLKSRPFKLRLAELL